MTDNRASEMSFQIGNVGNAIPSLSIIKTEELTAKEEAVKLEEYGESFLFTPNVEQEEELNNSRDPLALDNSEEIMPSTSSVKQEKFVCPIKVEETPMEIFPSTSNRTPEELVVNEGFLESDNVREADTTPESEESWFKCPNCESRFEDLESFVQHGKTHEDQFVCDTCGKVFRLRSLLNQHQLDHSKAKPYKCFTCNANFVSLSGLSTHSWCHSGRSFGCEICGKFYNNPYLLKSHGKNKHGVIPKVDLRRNTVEYLPPKCKRDKPKVLKWTKKKIPLPPTRISLPRRAREVTRVTPPPEESDDE